MRRSFLLGIVAIAVIASAGGYAYYQNIMVPEEARRAEQERWMKTLVLGSSDYLETIDPLKGAGGFDAWIDNQVIEGFWYSDPIEPGVHHPALADSWEFKTVDGKPVLDVYLKEGMKFQDGYPINTSAVLWTWDIFKTNNPARYKFLQDCYTEAKALDAYTLRIWLKEGAFGPQIMEYMGTCTGIVLSPNVTVVGVKGIGAGPWEIVEYMPNEKIVFKAHPEYPWGPDHLETMIIKFYKDTSSIRLALEKGDVDAVATHLGYSDLADLAENPEITIEVQPSGFNRALFPNENILPWNNSLVRRALAYVIDPQPVIDTVYYGYAIPSKSWVPPTLLYSNDVFQKTYRASSENERLNKAKALLAEAGYPNGFKSELWYSSRGASKETEEAACLIFKSQLAKVGIDVELKFSEWGSYLEYMNRGTVMPLQYAHWAYTYPDPDYMLYNFMGSTGWWSKFMGYNDTYVDSLLLQGKQLYDPDLEPEENTARKAVYEELQTILANDAILVPLYHQTDNFVYRNYVKGGPFCPWYNLYISFETAYKEIPSS